jgi:hypothetical protein
MGDEIAVLLGCSYLCDDIEDFIANGAVSKRGFRESFKKIQFRARHGANKDGRLCSLMDPQNPGNREFNEHI